MIKIHGTPMTPATVALEFFKDRHAMVSYAHPEQIEMLALVCAAIYLDNGAFSAWMAGRPITDWLPFRAWVDRWMSHPVCAWFLIPDVIDGDERDNDQLVHEFREVPNGVPVWHMHESVDRLRRLMDMGFERIALGSSGEFSEIGTQRWWRKMSEAMKVACDKQGKPLVKLHGLRMLNPSIFQKLPLASADSTNVARNIGIDSRWKGAYATTNKLVRAETIASLIEPFNSASGWFEDIPQHHNLFMEDIA